MKRLFTLLIMLIGITNVGAASKSNIIKDIVSNSFSKGFVILSQDNYEDFGISKNDYYAALDQITDVKKGLTNYIATIENFNTSECKKEDSNYPGYIDYIDCINSVDNIFNTIQNLYDKIQILKYDSRAGGFWSQHADVIEVDDLYQKVSSKIEQKKFELKASQASQEDGRKKSEDAGKTSNDQAEDVGMDCNKIIGPNVMLFIKYIRNIIMIGGPVLAIVLGTFEMMMAVAKGEDEDKKKAMKRFKNRILAAVLLLIVPFIITFILQFINGSYGGCV